jgi:hypothetical protein
MIASRLHALGDGDCATVVSSTVTHRDVHHLTIEYAEAVTRATRTALRPVVSP